MERLDLEWPARFDRPELLENERVAFLIGYLVRYMVQNVPKSRAAKQGG